MKLFSSVAALLALSSVFVLAAREDDKKAALSVDAILAAAMAAQNAEPYATDLKDVTVKLDVTTREAQGTATFTVERLWKAPNHTFTHVEEHATGAKFDEGFDGETFWHTKSGRTTVLAGVDFREDRDRIRQDVDLMLVMMRSFFLKSALPTLEGLVRAPDQTIDQPHPTDADSVVPTECFVLKGRMNDLPKDLGLVADVTLWIATDSFLLERVRLDPLPPEEDLSELDPKKTDAKGTTPPVVPQPTELRFSGHLANEQGVSVPSGVDVYRGRSQDPWQQIRLLGVESGDGGGVNNIRFNTGIDSKRFAPPKG